MRIDADSIQQDHDEGSLPQFGFDRAVELGIDLTLAGHTHGGQLSLEFLRRGLSLARLETPYVSGWFDKSRCQLCVNRGIGTTMIRSGSAPGRNLQVDNFVLIELANRRRLHGARA